MENVQDTNSPKFIFAVIGAFTFGVLVSSFFFVSPLVSVLILLVSLGILVVEKIQEKKVGKEVFFLFLILASFALGSLRYAVKDFHMDTIPVETGVVVSEPEDRDNSRRFVYLSDNGVKVLVNTSLYNPVQYGDRVRVEGEFEKPGVIESEEGGRDFDYGAYLSKDEIYYTLSFARVEVVSSGHGNPIKETLFKIKNSFVSQAQAILAEPYASLLLGLVVAGRDAMPKDILEEFRKAGVIHIVVLSGFNITLIAEFLRRVAQSLFIWGGFKRFYQAPALISILGVVFFVIMTGGEATIVRAAIMALIVVCAKMFGRTYSPSRALILAGFLMILENPKILVFDPSFQLSFLATLGLIYLVPVTEKWLGSVTEKFQFKEILSQTLATQIAVLPLLIYLMGDVSLVSLPANMLILMIVPATMLIGFLAVLVSYLSVFLAIPLTYLAHLLLSWILFVSHTLGSLSFATLKIPPLSIWVTVLAYVFLFAYLKLKKREGGSHELVANGSGAQHSIQKRLERLF